MDAEKMQKMVNLIAEQRTIANKRVEECVESKDWGLASYFDGRGHGLADTLTWLELAGVTPSDKS